MKKQYKPFTFTVSMVVEIDLNEILDGYTLNVSAREIRKNIGVFVRESMKGESFAPGDEIYLPEDWAICQNLSEFDLVSLQK